MVSRRSTASIERNMAMELVRVTEAAALAAARYMGKGDKKLVDQAAVDAMRFTLDGISMDGIVVIGEGEKDEAGEVQRTKSAPQRGRQCDFPRRDRYRYPVGPPSTLHRSCGPSVRFDLHPSMDSVFAGKPRQPGRGDDQRQNRGLSQPFGHPGEQRFHRRDSMW